MSNCWGNPFLSKIQRDPVKLDHSVSEVSELVFELSTRHTGLVGNLSKTEISNLIEPAKKQINEPYEGELNLIEGIIERTSPNYIEEKAIEITGQIVGEQAIGRAILNNAYNAFPSFSNSFHKMALAAPKVLKNYHCLSKKSTGIISKLRRSNKNVLLLRYRETKEPRF